VNFLVLSVTQKASKEAIKEGLKFGLSQTLLRGRVKTLDSYLINGKHPTDVLAIDEFPMAHSGKLDAAVSITGAKDVRLYGDGRQIPYDAFTAEFNVKYASIGGTVPSERIRFLSKTHRNNADVCAAWVDLYPSIYPCDCCRVGTRHEQSLKWEKIGSLADVRKEERTRYHTYTRAEADDLSEALGMREDRDVLKRMIDGGISTVHEDQGATHTKVRTVRSQADYDKNASLANPSLFNRLNYVLTDMTRHKESYTYSTVSTERDMVIKRVEASRASWRLDLVKKKEGMGLTTVEDMLANKYHPDIISGKTLIGD